MSEIESTLPCAVLPRDAADRAVARLAAAGIEAGVTRPGTRYEHIASDAWEVRVAAREAARARAVLNEAHD